MGSEGGEEADGRGGVGGWGARVQLSDIPTAASDASPVATTVTIIIRSARIATHPIRVAPTARPARAIRRIVKSLQGLDLLLRRLRTHRGQGHYWLTVEAGVVTLPGFT